MQLFIRQFGLCHWCGCPMSLMLKHRNGHASLYTTLDHIVKREHGGTYHISNVVAAHGACNAARDHDVPFHDHKTRMQKRLAFYMKELEFSQMLLPHRSVPTT